MTDDFEQRLRASLDDHAKQADPQLSGPELRRLAGERNRPAERLRRSAPVLATAAAIAGIGIAAAILTSPGDPSPPPIQPGGPAGPGTSAPTPVSTPVSPSPSVAPTSRPTQSRDPLIGILTQSPSQGRTRPTRATDPVLNLPVRSAPVRPSAASRSGTPATARPGIVVPTGSRTTSP